jgi:hypothetical protein
MIPDTVKRTRMESPPKTREVSQKKPKNEYNQILTIEEQKSSDVTLLEMINVLTTRMFISENRQKEQENHITMLKAQVVSIQKKLELAQKSINTAPLVWPKTNLHLTGKLCREGNNCLKCLRHSIWRKSKETSRQWRIPACPSYGRST